MTDKLDPFQEERDAIERIGMTHDGLVLHRFLRRVLESFPTDISHGALEVDFGRRSLARDLMLRLAKGIEANRERHDSDATVQRPASGARVIGQPGRRRVGLTPGDGWGGGSGDAIGEDPDGAA